jgi:hypothetical protein
MREGVCCHRGRSEPGVSYSGVRRGVEVENVDAEVRWRVLGGGFVRRRHVVVAVRARRGRLDAIVGFESSV